MRRRQRPFRLPGATPALVVVALACCAPAPACADFDVDSELQTCAQCHGASGVPDDPLYPIVWGQEYFYLYRQLRDFAAGQRVNEIMNGIAAKYSREQSKALASGLAKRAWPEIQASALDGDREIAERAAIAGQCSACHGKWYGNSDVPRVAGQQPGYLDKTMLDFKHAVRTNAPDKISTMQKFDDGTIAALARYLGAL